MFFRFGVNLQGNDVSNLTLIKGPMTGRNFAHKVWAQMMMKYGKAAATANVTLIPHIIKNIATSGEK